jgi:pilus assembly protein CpaE
MRPISVALAIGDTALRDDVRGELSLYPVRVVLDQAHIESLQLRRLGLDLVLIDTQPDGETVPELVQRIRQVSPRTGVAVVSRRPDPQLIIECMHAGAQEFVVPPLEENLRAAVERASARSVPRNAANPRTAGKVIGFVSAKGGCGSTSIACHVAMSLERSARCDVLLADFDMETGLVAFLMQQRNTFSLVDALRNVHRLDGNAWKRQVGSVRPHLDVLPSALSAVIGDDHRGDDLRQVFRLLRSMYGWVVADLGRGLNGITKTLLEDFDEIFMVTTPQVGALFQASQFTERLAERGYPRTKLHVVLNRTSRKGQGNDVHPVLGAPVYAEIPDRPELEQAYAAGKLLAPETQLGAHFEALAAKISEVQRVEIPRSWSLPGLRKPVAQDA